MEVFAGYLEHCDHDIGRLVDALEELEVLDDTLVAYIIGDNGGAPESEVEGSTNIFIAYNGAKALETPEFMAERLEQMGTPDSYLGYSAAWAWATDTPYQWTKQVASHWGGTRNGMVVHWPHGFDSRGELRSQFTHVIDIVPTILEAAGLPAPLTVNGVTQEPLHGTSMIYSFDDPAAAERHELQYFEMIGNRGIYHKGWTAATLHRSPWHTSAPAHPFAEDTWELYGPDDWSQAHNLAEEMPEKLEQLKTLWLIEASKYHVLPMDDRGFERFNAEIAGRPVLVHGRSQVLYEGMVGLTESTLINLKNKSFAVTADLLIPEGGAEGVVIAQGGAYAGWSLYVKGGIPHYCHNFVSLARYTVAAERAIPEGAHQLRLEFAYDGGGLAKGGTATLYVDGEKIGEGRVDHTVPIIFASDETADVGRDAGTRVTDDYGPDNAFTGRINWVQLDVDEAAADLDHLISPEDRARVVMGRH
jgi:arylsulfatase